MWKWLKWITDMGRGRNRRRQHQKQQQRSLLSGMVVSTFRRDFQRDDSVYHTTFIRDAVGYGLGNDGELALCLSVDGKKWDVVHKRSGMTIVANLDLPVAKSIGEALVKLPWKDVTYMGRGLSEDSQEAAVRIIDERR